MLRDITIAIITIGVTITLATVYIIVNGTTIIRGINKRWSQDRAQTIDLSGKTSVTILSIEGRK